MAGDLTVGAINSEDVSMGLAQKTKNDLSASGSAPIYACRAWVNFNGTGTVAIRASGNVSSITDNGVGSYTVNFITPMTDTNYQVSWSGGAGNGRSWGVLQSFLLVGSCAGSYVLASTPYDVDSVSVSVIR